MSLTSFTSKVIYSSLTVLLPCLGYGQSDADSLVRQRSYQNAKETYFTALGPNLNLYNGVYYKEYKTYENDEGQPNFGTDLWTEGSILYDGVIYENVPMLYNVVDDKLIIDHKFGAVKLELITELITYFVINGHRFVRLTPTASTAGIQGGFYELIYDGHDKAYAKWIKKRTEVFGAREIQVRYEEHTRFYIFNGKEYVQVKSKSSVMNVLQDKKASLKKYARKYNLNFGAKCIESIPKLLSFYESGSI